MMLDQVDKLGLSHGSSWVSGGRAFAIHDPEVFMNEISPKFFDRQTHLRSFHRQLSIWGFRRIETGTGGRGVWFHKHFIRDKPELIEDIKRIPIKNPKLAKSVLPNNDQQLPDYNNYKMPALIHDDSVSSAKASHCAEAAATKLSSTSVHQLRSSVAVAAGREGLSDSKLPPGKMNGSVPHRTQGTLDYLSSLGRMHQAPSSQFAGIPSQATISRYPSYLLSSYQHTVASAVTSMDPLVALSAANQSNSFASANDISTVARQLLAYRSANATPAPRHSPLGNNASGNINAAWLNNMVMVDSRSRGSPPTLSTVAGMTDQDLISAIARRNLLQQGPKP